MKKLLTVAALVTAMVSWAGGTVVSSYTTIVAAPAPSSATAGIPLVVNGEPVKAVNVTIADYNDGGDDSDYVIVAAANAWIYNPQDKNPDGGAGWTRLPLFDVSTTFSGGDITLGSVTAARGATVTLPSVGVAGTFSGFGNGSRLYYQPDTFTTIDGGSQAAIIRTTIQGRY